MFQPGQSGNPKGRPPGTGKRQREERLARERSVAAAEERLSALLGKAIAVVERHLDCGDPVYEAKAAELTLRRSRGPSRSFRMGFRIPEGLLFVERATRPFAHPPVKVRFDLAPAELALEASRYKSPISEAAELGTEHAPHPALEAATRRRPRDRYSGPPGVYCSPDPYSAIPERRQGQGLRHAGRPVRCRPGGDQAGLAVVRP